MDFDVNTPILVRWVGVFDSNGDGFSGTLQAAIFSRTTGIVVAGTTVTVTQSTPGMLFGGHRFVMLPTPVLLPVGQYSIVAAGFTSADPNGNTNGVNAITPPTQNTGGGFISFAPTSRYDNAAGLYYPTIPVNESARFLAGTFSFDLADSAFQVRYAANLAAGPSVINITNAGTSGGNICVNVYAFSPDEQLISCCSCRVTPNGLVSLDVLNDLAANTLTPAVPGSLVVKLLSTSGQVCNPAGPYTLGSQTGGLLAFGTTPHAATGGGYAITETPFSAATLQDAELSRITGFCGFIQANGSGYGICRSCRAGALGGVSK
jgi:hypothetical protein